ncbi:MAG: rhomboid family intramembrane serine protease [Treponema sp.]|nr:rhomboid family intramembrane serine protease [Treponema sp.]MCI5665754.1 rhomboid family intramembrane serine protease [Spirochaetia bacterium]MDD7767448.1 rhomboid family intramembrane serine protease [Treponema sp.]MDY3130517.1 rhomboid family intramembrane serine protease [Treponema sp.]
MSRKKISLKFSYDAPVSLSMAILIIVLFIIDTLIIKKPVISQFLQAPTVAAGSAPFAFSSVRALFGIVFHIFSYFDFNQLLCDLIFIMLLGPFMEERYGSIIIGIMIFVASLFSGVLNACFCSFPSSGAPCIVFMLILLDAMMNISKKKISASSIAVLLLFIVRLYIVKNQNGIIDVIIVIAGGLCGSLFAFIASPKARKARKENSGGLLSKAERIAQIDKESPRNKRKPAPGSSDETVEIGTLKF